jgi:hypothetical protein
MLAARVSIYSFGARKIYKASLAAVLLPIPGSLDKLVIRRSKEEG